MFTLQAGSAQAVSFFDDFESNVQATVWAKWPGSNQEILQTSTDHNHTLGGSKSARAFQADPTAYNAYHDFGATADFVRAEVYLFEDFSNNGTNPAQPITNMLALVGDNGTATPGFSTDYLQLGVVPFLPGGSTTYSIRSRVNGSDPSASTGVSRAAGWTKLAIEADALASGGQVRYYINDTQVGTATRSTGVNLRWIRLGNNSKSYENFWYDDVSVVPEPNGILIAGISGLALVGYGLRRRRAA
jgi:hypothetical protein